MKLVLLLSAIALLLSPCTGHAQSHAPVAASEPRLIHFSPNGEVTVLRQVVARFSDPMVAFGDPDARAPFTVDCPEKGQARWIDPTTWVYDFEQDLPAGISCALNSIGELKTLGGKPVQADTKYLITTGGPKIVFSRPDAGNRNLTEGQNWLLAISAQTDRNSIVEHAKCLAAGEQRNIVVLDDETRDRLIVAHRLKDWKPARVKEMIAVKCEGELPTAQDITLIWGKGISSPSGVSSENDQILKYVVRGPLMFRYDCGGWGEYGKACPYDQAINVLFTAPVKRSQLEAITLALPDGTVVGPKPPGVQGEFLQSISFAPPFPPLGKVVLHVPGDVSDDTGRQLGVGASLYREIRIADVPSVIAFTAWRHETAVLERKLGGIATVLLQNVETELPLKIMKLPDDDKQIVEWISRVRNNFHLYAWREPVLDAAMGNVESRVLRKQHGEKTREILGIELKHPGLYLLETASGRVHGAKPGERQHIVSFALVTNLAIHFRRSRENALVWVTTLDQGKPVAGADIRITGCDAKQIWQGVTDTDGLARIPFDTASKAGKCAYPSHFITARFADDFGMAYSDWRVSGHVSDNTPLIAHTVLDRSLFRAGETVSMKHMLRLPKSDGLAIYKESVPILITHVGSGQIFRLAPEFHEGNGTAISEWKIPADARLGTYRVAIRPESGFGYLNSSASPPVEFRVEEFRLPTMKAEISPPRRVQIAPQALPFDLKLTYLAGGGAQQPVRIKAVLRPASTRFPGYDDFSFGLLDSPGQAAAGQHIRPGMDRPIAENKEVILDAEGKGRALIDNIPIIDRPTDLIGEMEFADANGEIQTASTAVRLWPTAVQLGIKAAYWASARSRMPLQVVALGADGRPQRGVEVHVGGTVKKTAYKQVRADDGLLRYESSDSTSDLPSLCNGTTDDNGILRCSVEFTDGGRVTLRATAKDTAGRESAVMRSLWVADSGVTLRLNPQANLEVLPDKRRYVDGETARLQVRNPIAPSFALITAEREGIVSAWVKRLEEPVETIELPIKDRFAPNMYVSVTAVAGRDNAFERASSFGERDPGRPRIRSGRAEIEVPPDTYKLEVKLSTDKASYRVRGKAKVQVEVIRMDGSPLPAGAEVALVAVDEALLQLAPNPSWDILSAMFKKRGYAVELVSNILKVAAIPQLGIQSPSGIAAPAAPLPKPAAARMFEGDFLEGATTVRQLFDSLLLWKARLPLDSKGKAAIEVPLNDSLSEFRIVAIAQAGPDLFGYGDHRIISTKPLQIHAGLPPLVREGDQFAAKAVLRNTTEHPVSGEFVARPIRVHAGGSSVLQEQRMRFTLAGHETREVSWPGRVPVNTERLEWLLDAHTNSGFSDATKVSQKVAPVLPVTVRQAFLTQLKGTFSLPVERPGDALPGSGKIDVGIRPKLADSLTGVRLYMRDYPHLCLEQQISVAIATRNQKSWERIVSQMENHLDWNGFAKYWSNMAFGSEILTAYILAISHQARWRLSNAAENRMLAALDRVIQDRTAGYDLFFRDGGIARKLILLEALARYGRVRPQMLKDFQLDPAGWPTSSIIDWMSILTRVESLPNRKEMLNKAEMVLRSRLDMHGTTLNFSSEQNDYWWWYMVSPDQNALRTILAALSLDGWREDLPRLVRGALMRQKHGRWQTTTANAWGVLAVEAFSEKFEHEPVTGVTRARLASSAKTVDWGKADEGGTLSFDWPRSPASLDISQKGSGHPWVLVQSRAAVPLRAPISSGYRITKAIEVIQPKRPGVLSIGDVARVTLTVDAQSDMTWVAISDPIPAGTTILSRGLARDSKISTAGERRQGWARPSHEETGFEAFRAYYRQAPKGKFSLEYTMRFNSEGVFNLPPTRVEAMYAPEMFGETPNQKVIIQQR